MLTLLIGCGLKNLSLHHQMSAELLAFELEPGPEKNKHCKEGKAMSAKTFNLKNHPFMRESVKRTQAVFMFTLLFYLFSPQIPFTIFVVLMTPSPSIKNCKLGESQWLSPITPALREDEARGQLEARGSRLTCSIERPSHDENK